jgi:hypothetical protein
VEEYDNQFRKFITSKIWKRFTHSFEKVDYKYKQSSNQGGMSSDDEPESLLSIYQSIEDENSVEIEKLGGYLERALAYDAVWVMAYSLNRTLEKFGSLDNFKLSDYEVSKFIKQAMKQTNFKGVSGLVTFNDKGDRISEVLYEQLQSIQ